MEIKESYNNLSAEEINNMANGNVDRGKYPALKTIATGFTILGYLVLVIGLVALFFFVNNSNMIYGVVSAIGSIILSLPLFAFSNLIYLFIDIEQNTWELKEQAGGNRR